MLLHIERSYCFNPDKVLDTTSIHVQLQHVAEHMCYVCVMH
jgi:hypothetical protein